MHLLLENLSDINEEIDDLSQLIQEERSYNITQLENILQNNVPLLNTEQYAIYNTVIQAVE
jgi:hemolysin-activating ACP:hemolysin acyltransferase